MRASIFKIVDWNLNTVSKSIPACYFGPSLLPPPQSGLVNKRSLSSWLQFSRACAAFATWVDFVAARRSAKEVMARVVARFQNRLLSAALLSWQERVAERRNARGRALQVSQYHSHQYERKNYQWKWVSAADSECHRRGCHKSMT